MRSRTVVDGLTNAIVREYVWTQELLNQTPDDWFWRRVDWTDNAIDWHGGHITYHQDEARVRFLGAAPVYGDDRKRLFGFGCKPLPVDEYPSPGSIRQDFTEDHAWLLALLTTLADADITRPAPDSDGEPLAFRIGGVLARLAEHSGGISTLLDNFKRLEPTQQS